MAKPAQRRSPGSGSTDAERQRLAAVKQDSASWQLWGPYLAERQWGNPREDYSADGSAWTSFPHDHARSRVYRWGEDGMLGISDERQHLCFALALWNEADPILKERFFGLANQEGNHGEDVKELYFYLDNTPTHAYMQALYKYPQRAFPYEQLIAENGRRDRTQPEFELIETGVFDDDRYFDVAIEYAKAGPTDLLVHISATNRGPEPARLHVLPTLWFRNTWAWGRNPYRPELRAVDDPRPAAKATDDLRWIRADHQELGTYHLACAGTPDLLFTENETNDQRLWGTENAAPYVKDGIGEAVVRGQADAVNPQRSGTKSAAQYVLEIAPQATASVWLRLSSVVHDQPFADAEAILTQRRAEADAFYGSLTGASMDEDARRIQRQAFAGLLWSKQYYHYDVAHWLTGDPGQPPPPQERRRGRNRFWRHFNASDVLVMPDTWEFSWMASWDLAFHCVTLSYVDLELAKKQLLTIVDQRYQHPSGQIPAYEWTFSDVNPPVQAWAAWRVYQNEKRQTGAGDRVFLEEMLNKLLLNFTWWVNREDPDGRNVFQGGFLGLDNIGVFDRSAVLPSGEELEQADGTAWMGMYCLHLMSIALELAREDHAFEDMAVKFFEHFLYIAGALNALGDESIPLWDEEEGFFHDVLYSPQMGAKPLRVRSLVGLFPLLAVHVLDPEVLAALPHFAKHTEWFIREYPDLGNLLTSWHDPQKGDRRLLALVHDDRLKRMLQRMLDPAEFLSAHGVRSLSRYHADNPYTIGVDGTQWTIDYDPAESTSWLYGGNSNWRGPVWFPTGYLIIEALRGFDGYYGDTCRVECPTGSGRMLTLGEVANELACRMVSIFRRGADGRRPVFGGYTKLQTDPHFRDNILFHEYFHGDTGAGLGASHQTGWTALVAALVEEVAERARSSAPSAPAP